MNSFLFLLLASAAGALALVSQVVLLRQLLAAFYGTELVVALVLAGWLAGVAVGARLAGTAAAVWNRPRLWLGLVPVLWLLVLTLVLSLSFRLPALTGLTPGETASLDQILVWSAALTAPASLFAGFMFVLAGAFYDWTWPTLEGEGQGLGGTIFWFESAGSCLGLLAYTYLLVGRVGPVQVMAVFGGVLLLTQALSLPRRWANRALAVFVVVVLGFCVYWGELAAELDQTANQTRFHLAHPEYALIEAADSPYQHLALGERAGELALFGNNSFIASWPDPYTYQRPALFFLTEADGPDRVLLAGQGPGGFIHEFLDLGVSELVYVALDPTETALAARHLTPDRSADLHDQRLTLVHDDLRRFLDQYGGERFDLIVVNAPDPDNAQINRLYTLEFYLAARRVLSNDGVLITSISGADNYWSPELLSYGRSMARTIGQVFPEVIVTPGDRHYFLAGARPGLVTGDAQALAERYRRLGFDSPYFTPRSFPLFFPPTGSQYIEELLSRPGPAPVNTDARPLTYLLRLIWWQKMTGNPHLQYLLKKALDVRTWGPFALAIPGLALLAVLIRPRPFRAAASTMGLTGGVTMALQIVLIFMFQNKYGVLYQLIGLLSAMFMAGLAGGGLLGRLAVSGGAAPRLVLPLLDLLLAACAGLAALSALGRLPDLTLPVILTTGLLSGLEFALLYALARRDRSRPEPALVLARLEAADHLGAAIGILAAGLVMAPVLGLWASAIVLASIKAANGLCLLAPMEIR